VQPVEDLFRVAIRREDRVEDMLDAPVVDDQRVAAMEHEALGLEGRQPQGVRQLELLVAQDREGQMESLGHLRLVGAVLGRQAEDPDTGGDQLGVTVAVGTCLRRAAAGTRDRIPGFDTARRILARPTRPRIGEHDGRRRARGIEADERSVRCPQRDRWNDHARQVVARPVIDRDREVGWQRLEFVGTHRSEPSRAWPASTTLRTVPYDAAVSPMSGVSLRVERTGPGHVIARVTLARPDVHNAFDAALIAELRTTFATLAREDPGHLRAVVLAGDGPSFCAGADLAWMRAAMALDTEANEQDAMAMADMFEVIDTCPVPVIARVHGAALGGGMGLCAVADLVIAESGTRFGFTETRLGILPSVISPFVIAKIGESHARALFPGARRFDATRAVRIGLVHEIVEGDAALDAAVDAAIADLLAAGPTAARAAKAIVREVRGLSHGSAKWHTARVIARQRTSPEAQEGFRAFSEKRRPGWAPGND
jgi:methylglutaconyl-CoA hydratase